MLCTIVDESKNAWCTFCEQLKNIIWLSMSSSLCVIKLYWISKQSKTFLCICHEVKTSSLSYLGLTIMKAAPLHPTTLSLASFLPLHVQDVFLINGRRMDGLTEGPDNNGWSTGHKCSYWGDLWAPACRRLSSNRWDDFSKLWTDGSVCEGKALSLVPAHYLLIRCFGWKPLQEMHPGNNTRAVNMTQTGANKCERESETVEANQGQEHTRTSVNSVVSQEKSSCNMQELLWGSQDIQWPWSAMISLYH